ncbi:MAG: hypothetical protein CFE32_10655 [Alphaproteobacteria bacterium PA3]|nr:MAG: hypothetical protein CFE32_10655 [Alphaproteobacteria bacterium PA3]
MTTDELIAALARTPETAKPDRLYRRIALALIIGLVLGLVMTRLVMGFRPDIGVAAPMVALKAGFSALIATFAGGLAMRLAKPIGGANGTLRRLAMPLVLVAASAVAIGLITLMATEPGHRFAAFTGGGFPWCIILIPFCGLPTALLLVWAMREAAPTRLALAGAAIGALSGGVGAMVYAMFCSVDSVSFVTIWYVVGIGLAAALGAMVGVRLLRW